MHRYRLPGLRPWKAIDVGQNVFSIELAINLLLIRLTDRFCSAQLTAGALVDAIELLTTGHRPPRRPIQFGDCQYIVFGHSLSLATKCVVI